MKYITFEDLSIPELVFTAARLEFNLMSLQDHL